MAPPPPRKKPGGGANPAPPPRIRSLGGGHRRSLGRSEFGVRNKGQGGGVKLRNLSDAKLTFLRLW